MAEPIKLYLDEDAISRALIRALRARGVDIVTAQEAKLMGVPDDEQLAHATAQGRVIFTLRETMQFYTQSTCQSSRHIGIIQVYAIHVDQPFADLFINELLLLENVSREHQALRARIAHRVVDRLRQAKLRQSGVTESNVLLAYCLYFWESFASGYAFKVEIYRDLRI